MKKLLFPLLAAALLAAGAATAQTTSPTPGTRLERPERAERPDRSQLTPEQRAARQSLYLTRTLNLTPDQTTRIQQIILGREQDLQALRGQNPAPGTRRQLGEQLKNRRAKYDSQIREVLTADQYAKYAQLREDRRPDADDDDDEGRKVKIKKDKVKTKKTDD